MSTYAIADSSVNKLASKLRSDDPELAGLDDARVTVAYLFAHPPVNGDGEITGPAIKHHGWPAFGLCKINSLKDRVEGKADATITLDADKWKESDAREQAALLHHELYHLMVCRDEHGNLKTDDAGRPKLKMRDHDIQLGGFKHIAHRYQDSAVEVQATKVAVQLLMAWG